MSFRWPRWLQIAFAVAFVLTAYEAAASHSPELAARVDPWQLPLAINRFFHYVGLLTAVGGAMFVVFVGAPAPTLSAIRRGILAMAAVGMTTAALGVGLKAVQLTEEFGAAATDSLGWWQVLQTTFATSALVAIAGLAVVACASITNHRFGPIIAVLGGVVAATSFSLTGHSAAVEPSWLSVSTTAHTVPVAFWVGSLWPLLLVLHRTPDDAQATMERFSRIAVVGVSALIAAGLLIAALRLPSLSAILTSRYGLTLAIKTIPVLLLLLAAALNKWHLTPMLATNRAEGVKQLTHSIYQEVVAVTIILAVTAILSQTPTPDESG